ncbi:hypothetical protein BKA70DRAFT_1418497 [Coprinopsis sp. MPI-PUGE-AT-0042]|nr:hypothetical protein BKA70DRAFT_1418497 [Coprinopsis sp. MPI-PUGE-AT-0042]
MITRAAIPSILQRVRYLTLLPSHVNLSSWGRSERVLLHKPAFREGGKGSMNSVCSWSVPIPKEKDLNYRRKDREKLFAQCFCMACQIGEMGESETWRVTTGLYFNVSDIETSNPPSPQTLDLSMLYIVICKGNLNTVNDRTSHHGTLQPATCLFASSPSQHYRLTAALPTLAAGTKRASPTKSLPSKGVTRSQMPSKPTAAAPGDDRNARTDDDYYYYYLNSLLRVSKWINQTKQEMWLDALSEVSGVNDEYPASNLDFRMATSPSVAGETSSTISRRTVPTSVWFNGRGEGGSKSKEASPTKLKEREGRRKLKENSVHLNGTMDEKIVTTTDTALPVKDLKSRKSMKLPFKLDLDDASTVVRYPDMRPRTVLSGHEPTFTEVMHRLGTRNAAFGSEPSLATGVTSTTRLTERTGRTSGRDRLKSSKSKRSSSEPPEFELSWPLMQPILLILSLATLVVVLVPAVVVVALGAIAYCLDLLPEMVHTGIVEKEEQWQQQ